MSKAGAWMPFYIGDYLADTMHLSGPEHGAYFLLLCHSWRIGALPDNDQQLAAIARTPIPAWKKMAPTIRAFFRATPAGLISPRLEREREAAASNVERRAAAASKAAQARWQTDAQRNASRMPNALPGACPPPSPVPEEEIPPSPPSEVRSPRGSRLPAEWSPDAELSGFASSLGLAPDAVAAQFRDYWHAKAGKDAVKLDWSATWRGWCRREADRRPRAATGQPERAGKLDWLTRDLIGEPHQ